MLSQKQKIHLLWLVAVLIISVVMSLDPIPQALSYHQFADQRQLFLLPNSLDVFSNFLFLVVGLSGIVYLARHRRILACFLPYTSYMVFFIGVALVSVGSGYYHVAPDNYTLVWDRLPMTLAFMSFFSAVIGEVIDKRFASRWLPVLLFIGLASVMYWHWTEQQGAGDLRPYVLVQFYPMLGVLMLLYLFDNPPHFRHYIFYVIVFYALSKLLEWLDKPVYELSGLIVSGHSLKHIAAAVATSMIFFMIQRRHRVFLSS